MQVRLSPRKSTVSNKPKNKTAKNRPDYPSTNVSSPSPAIQRKTINQYMYKEDDEEEDEECFMVPTQRGKIRDPMVIGDDEGSDWAPVRDANPRRPKQQKPLGAPITVDQRISGLDDIQMDVLENFMREAKNKIKNIKVKKNIRSAPFSDTILREMCLDLPRNEKEMLAIPNINADMVATYGKSFLPLINETRNAFGCNRPVPKHPVSRQLSKVQFNELDSDEDDERPLDPNHQNVIDLCYSDEDGQQPELDAESVASVGDSNEDDEDHDDNVVHTSHYFNPPSLPPAVVEFNRRISQAEAARPSAPHKTPTPAPPGAGSSKPFFKKKFSSRKKGSGGAGRTYGGVSKRASNGTRKSGSFGAARKTPGAGRGGNKRSDGGGAARGGGPWSSIMAMPT